MKKILLVFALLAIVLLSLSLFNPIDTSRENSIRVSGIVSKISEGGVNDAVFELKNHKISYYINRGLERDFKLETLENTLVGKPVTIFYAGHWTPLAPFGTTSRHLTRIESDGRILYSEF